MPLQQIAVLSPKNLMEASNGKQTQEQTDAGNLAEGVNSENDDEDKQQAEAALETHVTIKTCGQCDESSDTSTECGTDSPDNGTAHPNSDQERNANLTQSTDTRRAGKRAKKEKPSPVKKKETLTQVKKYCISDINP